MTSLAELIAQKDELERRIADVRKEERANALTQARALIESFELSVDELFGKKQKAAKASLPAKYRDPVSGKTWSGKGRAPQWLEGKNKEDFAI
ncbi:H-NS family nucleoid-associated regulatory protein [Zoogloea sp.]|uniref:H-NS histone family protein n=1 Tax=Zoogloea sp. TaxID=49181 RepID=UPI0035B45E5A